MSARLAFRQVGRRFAERGHDVVALRGIDLVIEPGSFTAIVGPSGSGKSTLLHIAAGIDTSHDGSFACEPPDARLACLFQQPRLLPWKSARDNVAFVLETRGTARAAALKRADSMLSTVGLAAAARRFPSQLSGGMQQRVALARALVVDPDILLMDEPFSALDELTAARLREEIVTLFAARSRTIFLVTHNVREACYLADRIIVLSRHPGSIVADIPVDVPRPRRPDAEAIGALAARVLAFIEDAAAPTSLELAS
ncbi:MAG TPA: ABC transporter ATP-binding protein [Hyphomicrobiales bacterium]|nr:ABC transporter ATP-binding protein [Hyphomicrobiales bacterium]